MFAVDANYQLPYKYDTTEITNSSWVNPESYYIYSFVIKTNTSEKKYITNVLLQQVAGDKEPLEILAVKPQNGSCNINSNNKSVDCKLSYSFTESAHYPIEYFVKIKGSPQEKTTSSMFYITTNAGTVQCTNWLRIKPTQYKINPVKWETPYAKFTSNDFSIRIGNQIFYGQEPVSLHSDPGVDKTTLEAIWQENNVEMRLFLYFRKIENNMWELYDIRSYDGQPRGEWISYKDSLGNPVKSTIGYHDYADSRTFIPTDKKESEIRCKGCSFDAFLPKPLPISSYGYSLEALIGLPKGEIITISTDPKTGYGVNVILRDNQNQIVTNQNQLTYEWNAENPQIIALELRNLDYGNNSCAYGILPPCPINHVGVRGLIPGQTKVQVKVVRQNDQIAIAQTSFPVKVIAATALEQIPSPNPSVTLTAEQKELIRVKRDLDRISQELEAQKKSVNALQKIVESIREFLNRLFGRVIKF